METLPVDWGLSMQYLILDLASYFAAAFIVACGATLGYRLCKGK